MVSSGTLGKDALKEPLWWQERIKRIKVMTHILTWVFIYVFPYLINFPATRHYNTPLVLSLFIFPTTLAITFYVNYLWLVPRYMTLGKNGNSWRNHVIYAVSSLLVLIIAMEANHWCLSMLPEDGQYIERYAHPHIMAKAYASTPFVQITLFLHDLLWYATATLLALFIRNISTYWKKHTAQLEAENRMILNQASPHFLLNTLNGIYALIAIDPSRAQDAVHKFSKMLSYMIYEIQQEHTTLQREAEFIEQYVALMKLRLTANASITYSYSLERMNETQIMPMLLQPLVENAFKHGITNEKPCHVDITINAANGILHMTINNSNNPKTQSDRRSHGIGLKLTRQRLECYYKNSYKLKYSLSADEAEHITELTIKLT